MDLDAKKIGMWTGGFIASFLVLTVAAYFIYPYLNPKKAKKIQQKEEPAAVKASYSSIGYSLPQGDSLNIKVKKLRGVIDSLKLQINLRQQIVDSLSKKLELARRQEKPEVRKEKNQDKHKTPVAEVSKSLLSLDEEALAPIVDLLETNQLVSLYRAASSRQRQKLLRALKPEKAAKVLKKAM